MSFGRLGIAVLSAGVETTIYTAPVLCAGAKINLNLVNPGATDTVVDVALANAAIATNAEYIERGVVVAALGGTLEITGLMLSPGERVNVRSSINGAAVRVSGEELTTL